MFNGLLMGVELEKAMASHRRIPSSKPPGALRLRMATTLMDVTGTKSGKEILEDKLVVSMLEICNLEKSPNWFGPEPSPSSKSLQLGLLEEEGYEIFKKNQPLLKKGVRVPFEALFRHQTIHSTYIKSLDHDLSFHIRVDNNYYGPFSEIEVKPLTVIGDKHIYLPIMTFTPISEIS